MTIEAKTTFLGIPLGRRRVNPGTKFSSWTPHSINGIPVPLKTEVEVISDDEVRVSRDQPYQLWPIELIRTNSDLMREGEISGLSIQGKVLGLRKTLTWRSNDDAYDKTDKAIAEDNKTSRITHLRDGYVRRG